MKEQQPENKSAREVLGRSALYGGIIAGVIGLLFSPELLFAGIGLAAGGVIFEKTGKKKQNQPQPA